MIGPSRLPQPLTGHVGQADADAEAGGHAPTGSPPHMGDLPQPAGDDLGAEPVVGGWRSTLRRDGHPTYFERLYDRTDGDSPTQLQGVNPNRGPPDS